MRPRRATLTGAPLALGLFATAAIVVNSTGSDSGRVVQAAGELGAGGEYHALEPERIFDSRVEALDVEPLGSKPMDAEPVSVTFDVPFVGKGGLPLFTDEDPKDGIDDNVLAVAVSIVVISPNKLGFLRAFGKDAPEGMSSISNFFPGQFVPNMALLRPGTDGEITLRFVSPTGPGESHIAIDVFGWISSSTYSEEEGARVFPVGPGRIFDSRKAEFGAARLGPGSVKTIPVRGAVSFNPTIDPIILNDPDVVGVLVNIGGINNGLATTSTTA